MARRRIAHSESGELEFAITSASCALARALDRIYPRRARAFSRTLETLDARASAVATELDARPQDLEPTISGRALHVRALTHLTVKTVGSRADQPEPATRR